MYGLLFRKSKYEASPYVSLFRGPSCHAAHENKPSATPFSSSMAFLAPREDQSGMKKHEVAVLMSCQSVAFPGPSLVAVSHDLDLDK
jgi:hypothetical protein